MMLKLLTSKRCPRERKQPRNSQTVMPKLPEGTRPPSPGTHAKAQTPALPNRTRPGFLSWPSLSPKPSSLHFPAVLSWHTKYRPASGGWVRRMWEKIWEVKKGSNFPRTWMRLRGLLRAVGPSERLKHGPGFPGQQGALRVCRGLSRARLPTTCHRGCGGDGCFGWPLTSLPTLKR